MAELLRADVIVTLGAESTALGDAGPESRQRVDKAVALYEQGFAEHIVMSGAWPFRQRVHPEKPLATAMREYALEHYPHLDPEAVHAQTESLDTMGDALFTKIRLTEPLGWRSLIVVTTGAPDAPRSHVTRSKAIFEHVMGPEYTIQAVSAGEFPDRRTSRIHEAAVTYLWSPSWAAPSPAITKLSAEDWKALFQATIQISPRGNWRSIMGPGCCI